MPLVCANPDKVVIRQNGQLITCAGILADYYHNNGGEVFRYGKPFQAMYKKSFNIFTSALCLKFEEVKTIIFIIWIIIRILHF